MLKGHFGGSLQLHITIAYKCIFIFMLAYFFFRYLVQLDLSSPVLKFMNYLNEIKPVYLKFYF